MPIEAAVLAKTIEKDILALSSSSDENNEHFIRIGITVPKLRALLKSKQYFEGLPSSKKITLVDNLWKTTPYFEVMSFCLYAYQYQDIKKTEYKKIITWLNRVQCWEHSDDMSKILAGVVESHPDWIYKDLCKWNCSQNLWKRRQSLVALIEYASKRKRYLPFEKMIDLVGNLILDQEYYVQKAVGWSLREIHTAYPGPSKKFLNDHLADLSPIAYSTATEKLPKTLKDNFKNRRKLLRAKKRG